MQDRIVEQPVIKIATGIGGLDEITGGGLPKGRLTAIVGGPGAGKTVLALQTLVNRSKAHGEPGIFVTFEESVQGIHSNMASFDWGFSNFGENGLTFIEAKVPVDATVTGAFDLTAILAGITALKTKNGVRNIVFDGIDVLLGNLEDERLERRELARLNDWVTAFQP
jgi:circadian clock protein KaiC